MANFLLVHGASHGAWCWDRLVPRLGAMGHKATAIDLPGNRDVTMMDYVATALDAMASDTILVGHSLGGLTATLAAAQAATKVKALVYLCALVPRPGLAFRDFRAEAISPALSAALTLDREAGLSRVVPEKAADVFYHDCSEADRAFALERLVPQPVSVMAEPLDFEMPEIPMHYIRCLDDRVVMPAYQCAVSEGWAHVYKMTCGHSPFFADPDGLATILDRIAQEPG